MATAAAGGGGGKNFDSAMKLRRQKKKKMALEDQLQKKTARDFRGVVMRKIEVGRGTTHLEIPSPRCGLSTARTRWPPAAAHRGQASTPFGRIRFCAVATPWSCRRWKQLRRWGHCGAKVAERARRPHGSQVSGSYRFCKLHSTVVSAFWRPRF